jgi:hypothetical protein
MEQIQMRDCFNFNLNRKEFFSVMGRKRNEKNNIKFQKKSKNKHTHHKKIIL